jgi:hypothetical protein
MMSFIPKKSFFLAFCILFSFHGFAQKQASFEKEFIQLDLLADKGDYKSGLFYAKRVLPFVQKKSGGNQLNTLRTYCYLAFFYDKLDHLKEVDATLIRINKLLPVAFDKKNPAGAIKIYALLSEFYYQRGIYTTGDSIYNFINANKSALLPFEKELINYYHLIALYQKGFLNEACQKIDPAISIAETLLDNDSVRSASGEIKYVILSKNDKAERKNLLAKFILLKGMVYLKNGMPDSSLFFLDKHQSLLKEEFSSHEGYMARIHYLQGLDHLENNEDGLAEDELKKAASLAHRYFMPHAPFLIDIQHNLIKALLEEGKTAEAEFYNNDADVKINGHLGSNSLAYLSNSFPDIEKEMFYQNWPEVETRLEDLLSSPLLPNIHYIRAKALNYLFESLVKQQKHWEAEKTLNQLFKLQNELTGKQSPEYSLLLLKKAFFYSYHLNKFTEAKALFKEVFESDFKHQISIENPSYYNNMTSLARLYTESEEYKEALDLLTSELSRVEKERSAQHPLYAIYLSHLGELNVTTGEYATANSQLDKSLKIFEENPNKKYAIEYIEALELKIKANVLQGDYTTAQAVLKKAENVAKHTQASTTEELFLLEETGLLYIKIGKYQQA